MNAWGTRLKAGLWVFAACAVAQADDRVRIDGTDTNWYLLSRSLATNACYELRFRSTVRLSTAETVPTGLRVEWSGADKGNRNFPATGKKQIRETVGFAARQGELAVRLVALNPENNTGELVVDLAPCGKK